ncbi:MAG: LytTR family transcriptional regulator [Sphingobacteriia bacterium]|nr:LytTR family transcriptional regulator [Sphingobacteriia bacterium]
MSDKFFFVWDKKEYVKIEYADILYVESLASYSKIITNHKTVVVHIQLKQFEKLLPHDMFRRIYKSVIVNIVHIEKFDRLFVYVNNKKFSIGPAYREEWKKGLLMLR